MAQAQRISSCPALRVPFFPDCCLIRALAVSLLRNTSLAVLSGLPSSQRRRAFWHSSIKVSVPKGRLRQLHDCQGGHRLG
jgi:hypothetical protein